LAFEEVFCNKADLVGAVAKSEREGVADESAHQPSHLSTRRMIIMRRRRRDEVE
jgi:hypothetical protein